MEDSQLAAFVSALRAEYVSGSSGSGVGDFFKRESAWRVNRHAASLEEVLEKYENHVRLV